MKTKKQLIKFTDKIANLYKQGKIKAPIHLSGGSEDDLIYYFSKHIKKGDWVCSTHRPHYHYLLAGCSEKKLTQMILNGDSMHIYDKKLNFLSSAIVGGIAPIAVGIALSLKMEKSKNKVYCFIGDMAYETGICQESIKYAENFELPIEFIIEDNDLSVETPTKEAWGDFKMNCKQVRYKYKRKFPHHGTGEWVVF